MLPKKFLTAGALSLAMAGPALAQEYNEHIVIVTGFSYFPAITFAQPGDTVRFINQSGDAETVVGRDTGWVIGPLQDQEEADLVVNEETELAFFSAYKDCTNGADSSDDNCGLGNDTASTTTGDQTITNDQGDEVQDPYGTYEEATIKAEISFDAPILEADQSDDG